MIDGHVHVTEQLLPYLQDVTCIANADSPEEYAFLKEHGLTHISAGIHPWKADVTEWAAMEPILREAAIIGEIGLDREWCTVDMDTQRRVFRRQLTLAAEQGKPVILHTKGMEREILDTIRSYPNCYLVHWYACGEWLQDYIALGCWFTVGPDLQLDPHVEAVARKVPIDRLLIESDGLEGIAWAQGCEPASADYPAAMNRLLHTVAGLRNMDAGTLLRQMEQNLKAFLS